MTEVDEENYDWATQNVKRNKLEHRIRVRKVPTEGPLLDLKALGIRHADFVMCNPPFFTSREDMLATYATKAKPPSAVCTGAEVEMICNGGDLGFVMRIVEESEKLKEQVQWFSSMLGKVQSVNTLVATLKDRGITNWAVTCLQAGNVTRRWALAWSYGDLRPFDEVARRNMSVGNLLPFPTDYIIARTTRPDDTAKNVDATLSEFGANWTWEEKMRAGLFFAAANVWSRAARRKKSRGLEITTASSPAVAIGVRILILKNEDVLCRWIRGQDSVLYESFCGMMKRKLAAPPTTQEMISR